MDDEHVAVGILAYPNVGRAGSEIICAATLIGTRTILTAQHCLPKKPRGEDVAGGRHMAPSNRPALGRIPALHDPFASSGSGSEWDSAFVASVQRGSLQILSDKCGLY